MTTEPIVKVCGDCKFSGALYSHPPRHPDRALVENTIVCRRMPPQVTMQGQSVYPTCANNDPDVTCGEWQGKVIAVTRTPRLKAVTARKR